MSAQHIKWGGLENGMKARGFKKGLQTWTYHECSVCAREPGTSIRLRVGACAKINAKVDCMDSTIRAVTLDDISLHSGILQPPARA